MPIKPERLIPGDLVGIVAPASAPPDPKSLDRCVAAVEELGFRPKLARNARQRFGFLAGTDRQRASDLMSMFAHPKVKALFCVRGGYGTSRLFPYLDFKTIRSHPKILVGLSDITSLHCALLKAADLVSFHGPMLHSHFLKEDLPQFTKASFLRTLMQAAAPGNLCNDYHKQTVHVLRSGLARGRLIGGNISLLCSTLGTPYQPSFKGAILFFEDVDEVPYRFDRMLTHLLNAGLLQQVAGVAIGINAHCFDPKAKKTKEYRQTLEDVFHDRLYPLKVPVVLGLPFGHCQFNATIPVGVKALLDGNQGDLEILEAAVT
jgi:muramoyltetrapeptide carboxypeptidase